MRARWYVGRALNSGSEGTNMWQYIIPAISAIVVAVVEALAARDRSRAKLKTTQKSQEVQSDKCFI